MKISRSSRHKKIAGNFGEALILYWLSKHGFECAGVDHTGIDIIAKNQHTKELMGISVKFRTKTEGKEHECVTIRSKDLLYVQRACCAFDCEPYFAIVVDAKDVMRAFIASRKTFLKHAPKKVNCYWGMKASDLEVYSKDKGIIAFEFSSKITRWW